MKQYFHSIFPCAFCLIVFSCALSHKQVATAQNENELYFKNELSIDTACIEKIASLVKNELDFVPNAHKCFSTNKYERVIVYSLQPESGKFIFDGPGAFVALNDTCGIDTIITEKKK
jgi:hypothetical protein